MAKGIRAGKGGVKTAESWVRKEVGGWRERSVSESAALREQSQA